LPKIQDNSAVWKVCDIKRYNLRARPKFAYWFLCGSCTS